MIWGGRLSGAIIAASTFSQCKEFRAMAVKSSPSELILANLEGLLPDLETIYKDDWSEKSVGEFWLGQFAK